MNPAFDASTVAATIKREGICVLPGFLSPSDRRLLADDGLRLQREQPGFARVKARGAHGFFTHVHPSRIARAGAWDAVPSFRTILAMPLVRDVAQQYLGRGWGPSQLIFDRALEPNEELFPLHFDGFDQRHCLKAYFYLTDCSARNGAFRYVPRSHRLARAVMDHIEREENMLSALVDLVERLCDLRHDRELRECFEELQRLARQPESAYEHVVEGPAGTVLLFDSAGIHGGGRLTEGERYVARMHFVDAGYVFRHLPEQLSPAKRAVRWAWQKSEGAKRRLARLTHA